MPSPSVAILAIGDEILRGDVHESNAYFMAAELNRVGASLKSIHVVADEIEPIARWARLLADEHDFLIICGGVGPTHDDVTMEAVARAFDTRLVSHPELKKLLEAWRGQALDDAYLRLTLVPDGAVLTRVEGHFPVVQIRNVFVLPGVPKILKRKFADIVDLMHGDDGPLLKRDFYSDTDEMTMARALTDLAGQLAPEVSIGSYPEKMSKDEHRVRLTVTSRNAAALDRACRRLKETFPHLTEGP